MQTFKEENSQHNKSKDPKLFCKIYDTMNNILSKYIRNRSKAQTSRSVNLFSWSFFKSFIGNG